MIIANIKSDLHLSLLLLKLNYIYKFDAFFYKNVKNLGTLFFRNKNVMSLLFIKNIKLYFHTTKNLSLFYIFMLRVAILKFKLYNRFFFDKFLFFQRTVFNKERSPRFVFKAKKTNHYLTFVHKQKRYPGFLLALVNHKVCFLYRKFIFKFLGYSLTLNTML